MYKQVYYSQLTTQTISSDYGKNKRVNSHAVSLRYQSITY